MIIHVLYKKSLTVDGDRQIWYETSIDQQALAALAKKAVRNKSKKAHDGPLHVRIITANE